MGAERDGGFEGRDPREEHPFHRHSRARVRERGLKWVDAGPMIVDALGDLPDTEVIVYEPTTKKIPT